MRPLKPEEETGQAVVHRSVFILPKPSATSTCIQEMKEVQGGRVWKNERVLRCLGDETSWPGYVQGLGLAMPRSVGGGQNPQNTRQLDPLPGAPQCAVRVQWLKHDGTDVLEAGKADLVHACEYLVGEGKGGGDRLPQMFSGMEVPNEFAEQVWLKRDRALDPGRPGYEKHTRKWSLSQAWCVELATGNPWPESKARERQHFRVVMSPDPKMWKRIGVTDRERQGEIMQTVTTQAMNLLQSATETKLIWVASVHLNTDATHSHACVRGKDVFGKSVYLPNKTYVRQLVRRALWDTVMVKNEVQNVG